MALVTAAATMILVEECKCGSMKGGSAGARAGRSRDFETAQRAARRDGANGTADHRVRVAELANGFRHVIAPPGTGGLPDVSRLHAERSSVTMTPLGMSAREIPVKNGKGKVVTETLLMAGSAIRPMRTAQQPDARSVVALLERFAAPVGCAAKVQILRPFAVISRKSYSAPITLPIGPAYLAATLEKAGYPVEIIDAIGENIYQIVRSQCGHYNLQGLCTDEIVARITPQTRVLGISIMFSQEWLEHRSLIRAIRRAFPDLIIVVGGEHPTALPEYVLRDCPEIDYLVAGEGELTFLELVHGLIHGREIRDVPGVCFIDEAGGFVTTGLSRRIMDIDNLPAPAWHRCNVENYFIDNWTMGIAMGRNMPIIATRGCPYQCTFCSNPTMWTTRYKMRDVSEVVNEIEFLINHYNANSIEFFDLTAIVKKEWILSFCKELKRRHVDIAWQLPSGTRSEALDRETLKAICDAGCRFLVYAPESGCEETLAAVRKKIKLAHLTSSIRDAISIGHTVKVNFILGFPHERFRQMIKTVAYALKLARLGVEDCNISAFSPYPGSELFRDLVADGSVPALNDAYFRSLVTQFDFTSSAAICKHVPAGLLVPLRIIGQMLFYALAYTLHPKRIVRLVKSTFKSRFQANNLFEQRLYDFIVRFRTVRPGNRAIRSSN